METCQYPRMKGKQQCEWHWLAKQPAHVQQDAAVRRLSVAGATGAAWRHRVPAEEWPPGERWCAACQSMVPFFYTTGSRCRSCASTAAHGQRVEKLYGISETDYRELLAWQHGVCFICGRKPGTKRLAVDHDHATGEVRGLLCPHNEIGCNRAVVANLEASPRGGPSAARHLVRYFEDPPWSRLQRFREGGAAAL